MKPSDAAERERALASPDNLAVTAGAGTGKTTLLVAKILRKVLDEGADIRRILALTFTEKAATEMRERVRRELESRGRAENLDRAEIGTIHSFCAHVLRQFPVEAGVAPDFEVDEGRAFRRRFDAAWPRWLDRELGAGAPRAAEWREVLAKFEIGDLRELAEGLASFRIPAKRGDTVKTLRRFAKGAAEEFPALAPALEGREPPRPLPAKAAPLFRSAHRLAEDIAAVDAKGIGRAVGLVDDFARGFRRDYLAAGFVSFDAMLALVHELLGSRDFPDVLALLRERYVYILVDEFQDTDPLQGEIIRRLAEGPDGRLVHGKLFLVGDPKQSIYSFRGADIVAYQQLVRRILDEGGAPVVLRANFRSHGGILDLVNGVFSKAIAKRGQLQPGYEPIEPEEGRVPRLPGPPVEAFLVEGAKAGESRETEAEVIAEWIGRQGIPCRDIAVLFKALTDVPVYLEALRARGIPCAVAGEKFFYGTGEVIDFVNVLRAVANPNDRVAVAGVLRSPWGGLSDAELYERRFSLDYRRDSDLPIFGFLRRWNGMAGRTGVPELIDAIFEESFALEIAQAGVHGEQAVANLLKLRQKAEELEARGGVTLRGFTDLARRAVEEMEEEGESPLEDEKLDAVKVLSIHRAKGLEFPVVILPDLHRRAATAGDCAVRFDWPTRTLGVRLGGACDAGGAALAFLDRERRREEEKRLLYVAMTRAREKLVLLGSADAGGGTWLDLLMPDLEKYAKVTRLPRREAARPPAPPAPEPERPDWGVFAEAWRERRKRGVAPPRFTSPSRMERGDGEEPEPDSRPLRVGVECHRAMERLDFRAPRVPGGADPEVVEILEGFFRSEAFRELAEAEVLARELPFVLRRGGRVVEGVIDLVYRSGANVYAADYKTDKIVEPGEYALIREIYGEAVRRVFKVEPRFKLFYLRHGKGIEL